MNNKLILKAKALYCKALFSKPLFKLRALNFSTHCNDSDNKKDINFIYKYLKDGTEVKCTAKEGTNLLKAAHQNKVDIEGACDCSLACSTCHVILGKDLYDKLEISEEVEEDLLDLAFGLTETSRLGCQIKLTKDFEGTIISIPSNSNNQNH